MAVPDPVVALDPIDEAPLKALTLADDDAEDAPTEATTARRTVFPLELVLDDPIDPPAALRATGEFPVVAVALEPELDADEVSLELPLALVIEELDDAALPETLVVAFPAADAVLAPTEAPPPKSVVGPLPAVVPLV